jgi:ubiquitin C-terminal hydrolase
MMIKLMMMVVTDGMIDPQAVFGHDDDAMLVTPAGAGVAEAAPVGDVLAQEQGYCHILFDLVECPGTEAISRVIWELLLAIPTQTYALELVKGAAMGLPSENEGMSPAPVPEWSTLISSVTWHRTVYYLQIIDMLLQPSEDSAASDLPVAPKDFLAAFMHTGGFTHVLDVFMNTATDDGVGGAEASIQGMATAVSLRIVKFCLFGQAEGEGQVPATPTRMAVECDLGASLDGPSQMLGGHSRLRPLLDRLVQVALETHRAGTGEGSWRVTVDALATIEKVLNQPDMVGVFVENPAARELVVSTLVKDVNVKVRQQARRLVLEVKGGVMGQQVFQWGLQVLESLEPDCGTCYELFEVMQVLVRRQHLQGDELSMHLVRYLAKVVAQKVGTFPRSRDASERRQAVLHGYLRLVKELVGMEPGLLAEGELADFVSKTFSDLLFAVPSLVAQNNRPICSTPETRQLVFLTLLTLTQRDISTLFSLLAGIHTFATKGAVGLLSRWNYECSFDAKAAVGQYVGLRNQGCTCYMNSLLQQLFMIPAVREGILSARVRKRRVLPGSELSDPDLVNQRVLIRYDNGQEVEALVTHFDKRTGMHTLKFDGSEDVSYKLREGREGRELADFSVIPPSKRFSPQVIQEKEATQRVLEQVQRTFCYLQSSEKRFFDPRQLVEACRCLNLNYSVYQQNDASEFCDKLLDKLEAALKGTPQMKQLQMVFGGKFSNQKIPEGCDHRAEKEEPFIKVELIIRGKDSIQESLAAFVEGEMMDGENKVECESCNTKKATIRRTCLSQLPTVLILHLKRFDLDYQTYETVKLNNRCAFPMRLNMKPYTREGLEEAARQREKDGQSSPRPHDVMANGGEGAVPMVLDDGDYEYELKGVVIHAGVAQGGHYYSFIKDRNAEDSWYRFDDEDVTQFDPKNIEAQCFGGTTTKTTSWQGVTNTLEQERVANALMLFYEKVRPRFETPAPPGEDRMEVGGGLSGTDTPTPELEDDSEDFELGQDGRKAFETEVWQGNVNFIYHSYLLDHQLHAFLSGILAMTFKRDDLAGPATGTDLWSGSLAVSPGAMVDQLLASPGRPSWDPLSEEAAALRLSVFRMGVMYLLDVILHSRERPGIHAWVGHLKAAFQLDPATAQCFLEQMTQPSCRWLRTFFLECPDSTARSTVLQLVTTAVLELAKLERGQLAGPTDVAVTESYVGKFLRAAMGLLPEANRHWRHADELFLLFRDVAKHSDVVRDYLVRSELVALLVIFVVGERAPPSLRNIFPPHFVAEASHHNPDFLYLLEAVATLVGVPQIQKLPLLEEPASDSMYSDYRLTTEATRALTAIFQENSRQSGMSPPDISKYLEGCNTSPQTVSTFQIKSLLQKYDTLPDGRLSLHGFLSYYRDTALYNQKQVQTTTYII